MKRYMLAIAAVIFVIAVANIIYQLNNLTCFLCGTTGSGYLTRQDMAAIFGPGGQHYYQYAFQNTSADSINAAGAYYNYFNVTSQWLSSNVSEFQTAGYSVVDGANETPTTPFVSVWELVYLFRSNSSAASGYEKYLSAHGSFISSWNGVNGTVGTIDFTNESTASGALYSLSSLSQPTITGNHTVTTDYLGVYKGKNIVIVGWDAENWTNVNVTKLADTVAGEMPS